MRCTASSCCQSDSVCLCGAFTTDTSRLQQQQHHHQSAHTGRESVQLRLAPSIQSDQHYNHTLPRQQRTVKPLLLPSPPPSSPPLLTPLLTTHLTPITPLTLPPSPLCAALSSSLPPHPFPSSPPPLLLLLSTHLPLPAPSRPPIFHSRLSLPHSFAPPLLIFPYPAALRPSSGSPTHVRRLRGGFGYCAE